MPEPINTPLPLELTWSDEVFGGDVSAFTQDNGTLVAVGRDGNGKDGLAAWTSDDGAIWERHMVPSPPFIEDLADTFGPSIYNGTQMGPLTRLGDTLFSFGTFQGFNDFYRPLAWRSSDGSSWQFVESEAELYSYGTIVDAETFRSGLLASRATGLTGPNNDLWHWDADSRWQETAIQSEPGASLVILDAAATEALAVVVGQRAENDTMHDLGANEAIGWWSEDGREWTEFDLPDDMAAACGVERTPDGGYTVMGTREDGRVAVWSYSRTNAIWVRTNLGAGSCGDDPITLAGDWLVASLSTGGGGSKVWVSLDGIEWVRQEIPPVRSVAVAELNGELHILGTPMEDTPYTSVLLHGAP